MTIPVLEAPTTGNQTPKNLIAPKPADGFVTDHAEDALAFSKFYGLVADEWQATTCEAWMRQDISTGRFLASTWAITVSRQNGKNAIVDIVELYCVAELGMKFLHTAHEVKTQRKAFLRMQEYFGEKANDPNCQYPELNAMVKTVRSANGQEAIILTNGGSIEFAARTRSSGRGFTVDVLVLDEAQELQDSELEALKGTNSAAPSGQPVTIYLGTPPAEIGLLGEAFVRKRNDALIGEAYRVAWVEYGAAGEVDEMSPEELEQFVKDPRNWADANPAWGLRIGEDTIRDEMTTFSPRSFARERLNMWPSPLSAGNGLPINQWNGLQIHVDEVPSAPVLAYGIDMNPERTKVTISVAVDHGDYGPIHLELAADAPFSDSGTSALVDWLWKRAQRRVPVVIDAWSPAKSLQSYLIKKKMKVYLLNTGEFTQACANLYDAVATDGSITHSGQEQLTDSVKGVYKEPVGEAGAFKWNRVSMSTDLSPIISITCAYFGAVKWARRKSSNQKTRSAIVY